MAWNPNIPTITNRVQDDLDAIRENFRHLDQLAERVDELQTVSELAPIANDLQTVSGLAPVVEELQTVSGLALVAGELQAVSELVQIADDLQAVSALAPYVQALLDSRIVEHNLDVGGSNGYYVRFENGWQVCWNVLEGTRTTSTATGSLYRDDAATTWTFPAAFIASPTVYGTVSRTDDDGRYLFFAPYGATTTSVTYRDVATAAGSISRNDQLLALGRWK